MKNQYDKTITACFIAYIVQAIVNNFVPLLFLTFQRSYHIPLAQITMLVTFNFGVQLLVDLLAVGFVDKIGYKKAMVAAHVFSVTGLLLLTILPEVLPSAFAGILISVMIYAIGGGLLEVLVSPVVEACPSDNKEKAMSMLHSFYCWGHVGVVLLSTLFFFFFGIGNWRIMAVIWAAIPFINAFLFGKVPVPSLIEEGEQGSSLKELFGMKIFWILLLMMVCAGASELSSVYCIVSWDFTVSASNVQPDFLCGMRSFCGNYVAWHFQQSSKSLAQGRNCYVCFAGTWRRPWMFRWSYSGRYCLQFSWRKFKTGDSCCGDVPSPFNCRSILVQ